MAGIDIQNDFPNSRMAQAAKLGQSRFRSDESVIVAAPVTTPEKSGIFTLSTAGTYTTAQLLTDAGLTTRFDSLTITAKTTTAGITVSQGSGSVVLAQGQSITFNGPITATNNPVSVTLATGDVATFQYTGV